jgi:hypothetical protein
MFSSVLLIPAGLPNTACTRSPGKRRSHGGGTAARRDGVRVFKQFAWLEVGCVKVVLFGAQSRPRVMQAVGLTIRLVPAYKE